MVRWPSLLCVVFLICCSVVATGVALGGSGAEPVVHHGVQDPPATSPPGDFQRSTFVLTVYENRSVQWTVRHTKTLNESDEAAYRDFADRFNTTEMEYYTDFKQLATGLTDQGERETGRQMNATNFQKRAFVADPPYKGYLETVGVIEMSFTWSNFSMQSGQQLRLGDAFSNGLGLSEKMTFIITSSGDLRFVEATPDPDSIDGSTLRDSDSITWDGPETFNDGNPSAVLAPESAIATTTVAPTTTTPRMTTPNPSTGETTVRPTTPNRLTTDRTTTAAGGSDGNNGGMGSMVPIVLIVLVLGAGTGGVYYATKRSRGDGGSDSVFGGGTTETASAGTSPGGTVAEAESTGEAGEEPTMGEEALLSDTDRVEALLKENGGRMRQSAIVEETDWSKSKVSMLLSDMEDEERVAKLRVGRENIISLPGHEPDAAGSPFENEEE